MAIFGDKKLGFFCKKSIFSKKLPKQAIDGLFRQGLDFSRAAALEVFIIGDTPGSRP